MSLIFGRLKKNDKATGFVIFLVFSVSQVFWIAGKIRQIRKCNVPIVSKKKKMSDFDTSFFVFLS